ncbi:hypothetical protein [Comamonas odontotermitis]|uniref:hypothetical protein n=1 Tax=Comamonas TaxID=283 RepID=UPI00375297C2
MATRKQIDADSQFLGAEEIRTVGEIGGHAGIDVVDKPMPKKAIDMEAFMNERVTIMVNPPNNADEPLLVQVGVNGVNQFIPRGEPVQVKRKYVEVLARSKRTDFAQTLDERLGEQGFNKLRSMHSLRFPFSVLSDPNPNGGAWLTGVLAEAR